MIVAQSSEKHDAFGRDLGTHVSEHRQRGLVDELVHPTCMRIDEHTDALAARQVRRQRLDRNGVLRPFAPE